MEDALVLLKKADEAVAEGLNPCFNGRCTSTCEYCGYKFYK